MGLDALGDAYWIQDKGNKLINAVVTLQVYDRTELRGVAAVKSVLNNGVLEYPLDRLFSDQADAALVYACKRSREKEYAEIIEVLLSHPSFPEQLSYRGLVLAMDEVTKSRGNKETMEKVFAALEERTKRISENGVKWYVDKIRSNTVSSASGADKMLGSPSDAIAFAVQKIDFKSLITLARLGMEEYLDDETLAFARKRLTQIPAVLAEAMEFVLATMEGKRDTSKLIESLKQNVIEIKRTSDGLSKGMTPKLRVASRS